MIIITKGNGALIPITLTKKNSTFSISNTAIIKGRLTNLDRITTISEEVDIILSAVGSDLDNSLIIFEMTEEQSDVISQTGRAYLEIRVADPKKQTWTTEVLIRQGNIA